MEPSIPAFLLGIVYFSYQKERKDSMQLILANFRLVLMKRPLATTPINCYNERYLCAKV